MDSIKTTLLSKYNISITEQQVKQIINYCKIFENRGTHAQALNTALLGVYKIHFLEKDNLNLFEVFDVDKQEFKKVLHQASGIDNSRIVTSDPYNLFSMLLIYLTFKSKLKDNLKHEFIFTVLKLLHYKFFTSAVNHFFPHGANEDIMEATISSLSAKFDIKQKDTPTWRLVLEARCNDILSKQSIHYKALRQFESDKYLLNIIIDAQTRVRIKIRSVVAYFHSNKEFNNRIKSYNVVTEVEGDKIIKDMDNSLNTTISSLSNNVINLNQFIDDNLVQLVCGLTKNITTSLLKLLLTKFSDLSVVQNKLGEQDKLKKSKNDVIIYEGYRVLIAHVIQKTYRLCILDRDINMKNKLQILKKTQDIYKSSRIDNIDISNIKKSVSIFVDNNTHISRESTRTSLKIAFITYLICLSFKHI